jgi:hypothetical protein
MHYNYESPNLMMSTRMSPRQTKMLGLGIAAIAFLLASVPVFHSGVLYADEGDHGDHGDHDHEDHGDHDNEDHGDHDNDRDHGDHDHEDHGDHDDDDD